LELCERLARDYALQTHRVSRNKLQFVGSRGLIEFHVAPRRAGCGFDVVIFDEVEATPEDQARAGGRLITTTLLEAWLM
jgi:hypothetical protein